MGQYIEIVKDAESKGDAEGAPAAPPPPPPRPAAPANKPRSMPRFSSSRAAALLVVSAEKPGLRPALLERESSFRKSTRVLETMQSKQAERGERKHFQ